MKSFLKILLDSIQQLFTCYSVISLVTTSITQELDYRYLNRSSSLDGYPLDSNLSCSVRGAFQKERHAEHKYPKPVSLTFRTMADTAHPALLSSLQVPLIQRAYAAYSNKYLGQFLHECMKTLKILFMKPAIRSAWNLKNLGVRP
jgi:hypothetical protein